MTVPLATFGYLGEIWAEVAEIRLSPKPRSKNSSPPNSLPDRSRARRPTSTRALRSLDSDVVHVHEHAATGAGAARPRGQQGA